MRRRRNDKSQYAVTLFPFLAVLICTMGILVVLLVIAVREAEFDAKENAETTRASRQAEIDAVQDSISEENLRVDGLEDFRPDLVKRLADARARRAHVQTTLDDLDKEAQQLAAQQAQLNHPPEDSQMSLTQLESEAAILREQIKHDSALLETLKDVQPVETVTYSIVPTDTGSSTVRKPIYIECVQDKLVLQPHQVTLTVTDFQKPIGIGNPLDAALIVIRDYWQRYDLAGEEGDPYPLIVVRPSGARAYALARHAMQSWQDEFGYELVEESLPLEFGEPDPQLQDEINNAIVKAKQRRLQSARSHTIATRGTQGAGGEFQSGGGEHAGGSGSNQSGQYTGLTVDSKNGGFSFEGGESQRNSFESQSNSISNEDLAENESDYRDQYSSTTTGGGGDSESGNSKNQNAVASTGQSTGQSGNEAAQGATQSGTTGTLGGSAAGNSLSSIANTRGENWALPSRSNGGTVYRRPITIYCTPNELVVESGTSLGDKQTVVAVNGPTEQAIEPLVNAVWEKIDSWGFAGTGGYWKPELKINVLPGGIQRASDLRILLQGSGLDIDVIEL